ncbi:MAG TPA: hypothetical protein PLE19_03730 [Planctomycetota bacterium]|nr:hypothetical protein [Planctomycetota bacterium]HRR78591.1 hypothetical protein [Planctomycetota bacterium]HRT96510.1 hypothetical protein [Planctomycetota bacterium]
MPNRRVQCPECGHEFPAEAKWGPKDWGLYVLAVGPIGLMALVVAGLGVAALLRLVGIGGD